MTVTPPSPQWVEDLSAERAALGRASTAGRVADVLRAHVTEGRLVPGTRLSEEDIGTALGVSRNTLREAFRLLTHERLLVHEFNRGVFVRRLSVDDVRDLYRFRRVLECGAVRRAGELHADGRPLPTAEVARVREALTQAQAASEAGDWVGVGTANLHFHQGLAALAGSERVDEAMTHVLAELRLVFHVMGEPERFHAPYLDLNRSMTEQLEAGDFAGLEAALGDYLDGAENQLVEAYARLD